jgi:hypothetical protein
MKTRIVSVLSLLKSVRTYHRLYGDKAIRLGALSKTLPEWFSESDIVDMPKAVDDQPVLFAWQSITRRGKGWHHETIIFTPASILRLYFKEVKGSTGSFTVRRFATMSPRELALFARRRAGFAEDLAGEVDCFFWRIERNKK